MVCQIGTTPGRAAESSAPCSAAHGAARRAEKAADAHVEAMGWASGVPLRRRWRGNCLPELASACRGEVGRVVRRLGVPRGAGPWRGLGASADLSIFPPDDSGGSPGLATGNPVLVTHAPGSAPGCAWAMRWSPVWLASSMASPGCVERGQGSRCEWRQYSTTRAGVKRRTALPGGDPIPCVRRAPLL
jgi:hypothetical protein